MSKYESAYILSHTGLGDNITMIGAINFLLLYYNHVYLLCKDKYKTNVELLINNSNVSIISFDHKNEENNCKKIINSIDSNDNIDIFICGKHKSYLNRKITNPSILNYKKNDKYDIKWKHIKMFYEDMNLDLNIYYDYFDIVSTELSMKLYESIKELNIVFCHTQSSTKTIDLPDEMQRQYLTDNKYIVVCANKNQYIKTHKYFELANKFVNIPLQHYIDIIKHACEIFLIDSCFCCIVHPLSILNKLNAKTINYHIRR